METPPHTAALVKQAAHLLGSHWEAKDDKGEEDNQSGWQDENDKIKRPAPKAP